MTLADAIIEENIDAIVAYLRRGAGINELDEYGFTPLIEAAIADNIDIAQLLIANGADVNLQDATGGTALHWATENNNLSLTRLLLEHRADPNSYNFAGQPVLVMPLLRQQQTIKKLLLEYGADLPFAQDYINTKLLGHMFELVGTADIVDRKNNFVEVDFEGFFLEFSIGLIGESLAQFKNHYAARQLRHYMGLIQAIIDVFTRASELVKFQQYRVEVKRHTTEIDWLLEQEPFIIPVHYEGHAITFIKFGRLLVKCDRREESRLYDNIMFYLVQNPEAFTKEFIKNLMYEPPSSEFVNVQLHELLRLQPLTELKVTAQISGNCSWANVEACIPALFLLFVSQKDDFQENLSRYKNQALNFFTRWREWNKERALYFCIDSFQHADFLRKACKAEILVAILFQCCDAGNPADQERIRSILSVLATPQYEYVLKNYLKIYCYESQSEEGKNYLRMLKAYGYL